MSITCLSVNDAVFEEIADEEETKYQAMGKIRTRTMMVEYAERT